MELYYYNTYYSSYYNTLFLSKYSIILSIPLAKAIIIRV